MDELLNYPKFDPHGEPIPDKDGNIIAQHLKKLSTCKEGSSFVFTAVTITDDDFLSFLNAKNLELGTAIEIIEIEKYDQSMKVQFGGKMVTLSKIVTEKILVKE